MKFIKLTRGKTAIVDDDTSEAILSKRWYAGKNGYVCRDERADGKRVCLLLHRLIINAPPTLDVDHIDGNPLNNTRSNLRLCRTSENCRHQKMKTNNTSGFKGVFFDSWAGKWRAGIRTDNGNKKLGRFENKIDAARAYDLAARQHHGEFAITNTDLGLL